MYFPYFRGKQNELIAIREQADLLAESNFIPIIEPVKQSTKGLKRALDAIVDAKGEAIVVTNPILGDHSEDFTEIEGFLHEEYEQAHQVSVGIVLNGDVSVKDVVDLCSRFEGWPIALLHSGFNFANELAVELGDKLGSMRQIFFEDQCGRIYRSKFSDGQNRVLLRDGFERRINREHPSTEFFSDLHITYEEEGMDRFGDFLIVGDDYAVSGGPAYAIAIHLTFINPARDDEMHIHHFVSDRTDTPADPAGKFAEALVKLVAEVRREGSCITQTNAVSEFLGLHERGHYPGLGYVKKIAMQHHIETLADYFAV